MATDLSFSQILALILVSGLLYVVFIIFMSLFLKGAARNQYYYPDEVEAQDND